MTNTMDEHFGKIVGGAVAAVFAVSTWVVRTVFTNHKHLQLLEQRQDMQHNEAIRAIHKTEEAIERIVVSNDRAMINQERILKLMENIHNASTYRG